MWLIACDHKHGSFHATTGVMLKTKFSSIRHRLQVATMQIYTLFCSPRKNLLGITTYPLHFNTCALLSGICVCWDRKFECLPCIIKHKVEAHLWDASSRLSGCRCHPLAACLGPCIGIHILKRFWRHCGKLGWRIPPQNSLIQWKIDLVPDADGRS